MEQGRRLLVWFEVPDPSAQPSSHPSMLPRVLSASKTTSLDALTVAKLWTKACAKWALTPTGKKVLAAGSNRRNSGGFSV